MGPKLSLTLCQKMDGNTEMKIIHKQEADIGVPQHYTSQFCDFLLAIIAIIKFTANNILMH